MAWAVLVADDDDDDDDDDRDDEVLVVLQDLICFLKFGTSMEKFVWRLRGWEGFDRCGERETGERDEAWF